MRWALVVCVAACRFRFDPVAGDGATRSGDAPGDAPCTFGPWSTPTPIAELNTNANEQSPNVTPDELTIYFYSDRGTKNDLYRADRPSTDVQFGPAMRIAVNTPDGNLDPQLAADGTRLYFTSYNATTGSTLEVSTVTGMTYTTATPVPGVGSDGFGAWVSNDELEILVSGTTMLDRYTRASTSDTWTPMGTVTELGQAGYATLSADELEIYFETDRLGHAEIFTATRATRDGTFEPPVRVDVLDDPVQISGDPDLSRDGRTIRFDRGAPPNQIDLAQSTRECQ